MKYINIPVDSAEAMINQHSFLKNKNEEMAKVAFAQMREFIEAASYHQQQIDTLSKAVKDVTFMLSETKKAIPTNDGGSTSEPASATPMAEEVNGDAKVESVRKSELVSLLKQHEAEFGEFDVDVELIASFLMAK